MKLCNDDVNKLVPSQETGILGIRAEACVFSKLCIPKAQRSKKVPFVPPTSRDAPPHPLSFLIL